MIFHSILRPALLKWLVFLWMFRLSRGQSSCIFSACSSCVADASCRWCQFAAPMQGQSGMCVRLSNPTSCETLYDQGALLLVSCDGKTAHPTPLLTRAPSPAPTLQPTPSPTAFPTLVPSPPFTPWPTSHPTIPPTATPTVAPQQTAAPTRCIPSEWSEWSPCSITCVSLTGTPGTRQRTREIIQSPDGDPNACSLPKVETAVCWPPEDCDDLRCAGQCSRCSVYKFFGSEDWCRCCALEDRDEEFWLDNPCHGTGCPDSLFGFADCKASGFCSVGPLGGDPLCWNYGFCSAVFSPAPTPAMSSSPYPTDGTTNAGSLTPTPSVEPSAGATVISPTGSLPSTGGGAGVGQGTTSSVPIVSSSGNNAGPSVSPASANTVSSHNSMTNNGGGDGVQTPPVTESSSLARSGTSSNSKVPGDAATLSGTLALDQPQTGGGTGLSSQPIGPAGRPTSRPTDPVLVPFAPPPPSDGTAATGQPLPLSTSLAAPLPVATPAAIPFNLGLPWAQAAIASGAFASICFVCLLGVGVYLACFRVPLTDQGTPMARVIGMRRRSGQRASEFAGAQNISSSRFSARSNSVILESGPSDLTVEEYRALETLRDAKIRQREQEQMISNQASTFVLPLPRPTKVADTTGRAAAAAAASAAAAPKMPIGGATAMPRPAGAGTFIRAPAFDPLKQSSEIPRGNLGSGVRRASPLLLPRRRRRSTSQSTSRRGSQINEDQLFRSSKIKQSVDQGTRVTSGVPLFRHSSSAERMAAEVTSGNQRPLNTPESLLYTDIAVLSPRRGSNGQVSSRSGSLVQSRDNLPAPESPDVSFGRKSSFAGAARHHRGRANGLRAAQRTRNGSTEYLPQPVYRSDSRRLGARNPVTTSRVFEGKSVAKQTQN